MQVGSNARIKDRRTSAPQRLATKDVKRKAKHKPIVYSDAISADSAGEMRAAGGMDDGLE